MFGKPGFLRRPGVHEFVSACVTPNDQGARQQVEQRFAAREKAQAYGMDVTLGEARLQLTRARVDVSTGRSSARAKVEQRGEVADAISFGRWARGISNSSPTPRARPSDCPTARCHCGVRSTTAPCPARSGS